MLIHLLDMVVSEEKPQQEQPLLIAEKVTKDATDNETREEERSVFENGNGNGHTSKTSDHNDHQNTGSHATARGNEMPSKSRFFTPFSLSVYHFQYCYRISKKHTLISR
jgi:hypothetical protein